MSRAALMPAPSVLLGIFGVIDFMSVFRIPPYGLTCLLFTFSARVVEQGHMVPMDKPKQAMLMINKFTRNEPFTPSSSMDAPKLFQLRRMGVSDEVAKDLS